MQKYNFEFCEISVIVIKGRWPTMYLLRYLISPIIFINGRIANSKFFSSIFESNISMKFLQIYLTDYPYHFIV